MCGALPFCNSIFLLPILLNMSLEKRFFCINRLEKLLSPCCLNGLTVIILALLSTTGQLGITTDMVSTLFFVTYNICLKNCMIYDIFGT